MLDWLLDGVFTWLAERIQGLLGSLLGLMTSAFFTTADVTALPQVQTLAARSASVVDAVFALAVIVAGGLGMTHGSVQIRYELKDLVPRLVVGFVASSFGVALCAGIIQVANAVTTTLVGQAAAGPRVVAFVKTGMAAAIVDPAVRALVAVIALVIVVLFFQLLLSAFLRVLTLLIVAGVAPVALGCYALPHTQPVAQLWWRVLLGAVVTPMLQAVAFSAGVDLLLDPAHNLPNMIGIPGLPGSAMTTVTNLVMVPCLLLVTVRIPRLVARYALRGGSATSPLAVMVRAVDEEMGVPSDPAQMLAALLDPVLLQVFAAMATRIGPGRATRWPSTTREVNYLTPTGTAKLTGVSVDEAAAAFRALQTAGLAIPYPTNPKRNGWRLDTDSMTAAAGDHSASTPTRERSVQDSSPARIPAGINRGRGHG